MAEEVLRLILATKQDGDFQQWFLNFFQDEEIAKCTIEEFAVFFLNFIRNQTEEYMKNNASTCNTPFKLQKPAPSERSPGESSSLNQIRLKCQQLTGGMDDGNNSNKSNLCHLFAKDDESSRKIHELMKSPQLSTNTDNGIMAKKQSNLDYNNFTSDLKTPSSPQPIAIRRLSVAESNASPNKSTSSLSSFTSTPSSRPNISQHNRTGNNNSCHLTCIRSDDSHSFDDSWHLDTSIGIRQSHEKSKDRRNYPMNTSSSLCLGDFLTASTSKQHLQRARKSSDSFEQSPNERTPNEKDFPNFTPKGKINRIALISSPSSSPSSAIQASDMMVTPTPKSNYNAKPKKRVVPTRISTNSDEFNCPAFRSDNNILNVSHDECADSAHDLLKSQKDMIRRVFQVEQPNQTSTHAFSQVNIHQNAAHPTTTIKETKRIPPLNLNQITNKFLLDKFIDIYSTILDLNLITNILTELSYLVNLINADLDEYYERNPHMVNTNSNDRTNAIESTTLKEINADGGKQSLADKQCDKEQLEMKELQHQQQKQQQYRDRHQALPQFQPQQNQIASNTLHPVISLDCNTATLNELSTCATKEDNVNDIDIDTITLASIILKNINNCVYFGLGVLKLQCSILRLLDITSIKVLLENERLTTLNATLTDDLMKVYSHKMQLERSLRSSHNTSHTVSSSILNVTHNGSIKVFYQQDQDTQINFPSTREFGAFKKQRDIFYSILGTWEAKHLNPTWNFETELGQKVQSMLNLMDHPINMAHMAKLFTSQLILSCNFNEVIQSEIQSDLPNIDPTKLNKLRQRLIAPSDFSTPFQFSGNQIFFKDFIVAAQDQTIFIEQLKIILTNELIDMNDSSYETLNLSTIDENDHQHYHEYIVRPETLSTLSVLAKFLGLIMARPFVYEFGINTTVDKRQIELRNKICSPIDIKAILKNSIVNQKLIVTLPWVVQFISMLDSVSLRSKYYRDVFHMFYELYMMTSNCESNTKLSLRPTSVFIIRSCLGWLFDQQNVPNEYYLYRQTRNPIMNALLPDAQKIELINIEIFVRENVASFFQCNNQRIVLNGDYKHDSAHQLCGTFEKLATDRYALSDTIQRSQEIAEKADKKDTNLNTLKDFDPLLESVLQAACPFLADFRVSIMPKRNSKVISRTGRLRHITPKTYQPSMSTTSTTIQTQTSPRTTMKSNNKTIAQNDTQTKLVDAFLHSQSLSVRRTVEFVQERVYSAVVKDFQIEILMPFKRSISEAIDKIQLNDSQAILDELYQIYANGEKELLKLWQEFVTSVALDRVKEAFDALLPHETVDACKLTCINIAVQRALAKVNDWRTTHLKDMEIFSKDIQADVEKVLNNTLSMQPQMKNTFKIDLTVLPPWKVFDGLQYKLHQLSMYPDQIQTDNIEKILTEIQNCIKQHVLPDSMHKTIGMTTVYLLLLLVCNRPEMVTKSIIEQFIKLWKLKQFTLFVQPPSQSQTTQSDNIKLPDNQTKVTSDTIDTVVNAVADTDASIILAKPSKPSDNTYLFSVILSPVNVYAQQAKPRIHFEKLADLIITLIENRLMSLAFLNEQCMNLLHMQWDPPALDKIAITIQCVIDRCRSSSESDDVLFSEMLVDLIRGMDDITFDA